ncbi:MAG: hypothetical protein ACT4PT_14430 [Methanobacteriota archaeon]
MVPMVLPKSGGFGLAKMTVFSLLGVLLVAGAAAAQVSLASGSALAAAPAHVEHRASASADASAPDVRPVVADGMARATAARADAESKIAETRGEVERTVGDVRTQADGRIDGVLAATNDIDAPDVHATASVDARTNAALPPIPDIREPMNFVQQAKADLEGKVGAVKGEIEDKVGGARATAEGKLAMILGSLPGATASVTGDIAGALHL